MGFSNKGQNISGSQIIPSPQDFGQFTNSLKEFTSSLGKIDAICGGVTGVLNPDKTLLVNSAHLLAWVGKPIKQMLVDMFGSEVFLENDAALGALGEATKGTGIGHKLVAYITVGTGIGGARVVNGKIDEKVFGFEPGHQIISLDGMEFEQYISGTSLQNQLGTPPEQIDDPKIWDEAAQKLSIGLNNIILLWSPDILILGGGLMQKIHLDRIRFHLSRTLKLFPKPPEIALSKLGELAGITGALEYLRQNTKA